MKPNTWAMLCHLGGLTGYVANGLGSIIVPLVVWIIKKDEIPEVDQHGTPLKGGRFSSASQWPVLSAS